MDTNSRKVLKDRYKVFAYYFRLEAEVEKLNENVLCKTQPYQYFKRILTSPSALNRGKNGNSTVLYLDDGENGTLEKVISDKDTRILQKANDFIIIAESYSDCNDCDLKRIKILLKVAAQYKTKILTKYFGHSNFPDIEHIHNLQGIISKKYGELDQAIKCFLKCVDILMDYPYYDNIIVLEMFFNIYQAVIIPCIYREDSESRLRSCLKVLKTVETRDPSEHFQKLSLYPVAVSSLRMSNDCEGALKLHQEAVNFACRVRKLVKKDEYQSSQQLYQIAYLSCLLDKQSFSEIINQPMTISTRKYNVWLYSEVIGDSHYNLGNYQEAINNYVKSLNHKCVEHYATFCCVCNVSWIGLIISCIKINAMKPMSKYLKPIVVSRKDYTMFNIMLRKNSVQPKIQTFFHCLKTKTILLIPCNNCKKCHECVSGRNQKYLRKLAKRNKHWRLFKNSNMVCTSVRNVFLGNISPTLDEKFLILR